MDQIATWLEQHNVNVTTVVVTLALLIGASIVILKLSQLLRRSAGYLEARFRLPYATVMTITRAITAALWLIVGMIVLDIWGVGVGGLWTVLVSAATVIGVGFLATWTMVSNVTASFFLTLWRPFHHGDTVEVLPENLRGRMIDRNLMFTVLREESGSVIQVPNNLFFQKMFRVIDGSDRSLFELLEPQPTTAPRRREQLGTATR